MKEAKKILLFVLMIPFITLPIYSYYVLGVFSWHISVVAFWNDAFELTIYLCILFFLGMFFDDSRGAIILIVSCTYLLSIGTLLQVIVAYAFVEGIILIGRVYSIRILRNDYSDGFNFVIGSIVLGIIDIMLSLIGIGTINDLRIAYIVAVLIFIMWGKKDIHGSDLLIAKGDRYLKTLSKRQFILLIPIVACVLLAFARVNTHIESDSSWYALYTDKNLFGENSFYDFLGYTGFIYYYPKFKELLMAPISGLRIAGYLIAPNIWIMILMVIETYKFLKLRIRDIKEEMLIVTVSLIYTTMAIIGTAGTAKSDTLGYLFILVCWIGFNRFIMEKDYNLLVISIASAIMSYTVKYTHYVWTTVILFSFLVYLFFLYYKKKVQKPHEIKNVIPLVVMSVLVLAGILWRTIKITGFPFGRIGIGILEKIGFNGKALFEFDEASNMPSVFLPIRIWQTFFMSGQANKITAQWVGNYFLFFAIVIFLIIPLKKIRKSFSKDEVFEVATVVILNIISLFFLITMHGPDGNYFEFTIIVTSLEIVFIFCKFKEHFIVYKKVLIACLCMFCTLNIILNFTVNPAWGCATRFSYDPIKTIKTQEDNRAYLDSLLSSYGLTEINNYLRENESNSFIVIDSETTLVNYLDARVEIASDLSNPYISAAYGTGFEDFVMYVDTAGVKGFILSNDDSGDYLFESYAKQYLNTYGWITCVKDLNYTYYKIG